jgi:Mn-dependent DtxR family transcriptional regulator
MFFLRDVLGVQDDIAEKDACKMEHILSEETLSKMHTFANRDSVGTPAHAAPEKAPRRKPSER